MTVRIICESDSTPEEIVARFREQRIPVHINEAGEIVLTERALKKLGVFRDATDTDLHWLDPVDVDAAPELREKWLAERREWVRSGRTYVEWLDAQ